MTGIGGSLSSSVSAALSNHALSRNKAARLMAYFVGVFITFNYFALCLILFNNSKDHYLAALDAFKRVML